MYNSQLGKASRKTCSVRLKQKRRNPRKVQNRILTTLTLTRCWHDSQRFLPDDAGFRVEDGCNQRNAGVLFPTCYLISSWSVFNFFCANFHTPFPLLTLLKTKILKAIKADYPRKIECGQYQKQSLSVLQSCGDDRPAVVRSGGGQHLAPAGPPLRSVYETIN